MNLTQPHDGLFAQDVRAEYLRASRKRVASIVADYRASAGVDLVVLA